MEGFLNLVKAFLGMCFPLHKPYRNIAYISEVSSLLVPEIFGRQWSQKFKDLVSICSLFENGILRFMKFSPQNRAWFHPLYTLSNQGTFFRC